MTGVRTVSFRDGPWDGRWLSVQPQTKHGDELLVPATDGQSVKYVIREVDGELHGSMK